MMNQREIKWREFDGFHMEYKSLKSACPSLSLFTGLKDKNGKEIYEGDIVRGKVDYQGKSVEITAPVEWMTRAVMFMVHDIYRINQTGFGLCAISKIKVIGNIYENPELLMNLK